MKPIPKFDFDCVTSSDRILFVTADRKLVGGYQLTFVEKDNIHSCYELNRLVKNKQSVIRLCKNIGIEKDKIHFSIEKKEDYYKTIYFISSLHLIKIGVTSDINRRIRDLECMNAAPLRLIYSYRANPNEEKIIHKKFNKYRSHGEWFYYVEEINKFILQHEYKTQPNKHGSHPAEMARA